MACALFFAMLPAARADRGPWPDRGDARGPLAIRKIEIGHAGLTTTLTVSFERPVYPGRLSDRDFFVLDIDGREGPKSDLWLFFVGGREKWRVVDVKAMSLSRIKRLSPRTFKIWVHPHSSWHSPFKGGYRFRLASYSETGSTCARGCWDFVPNASWLIHDWTKPDLKRLWSPQVWMNHGELTPFPVQWRVTDRGYSGLWRRTLWGRTQVGADWTEISSGRSTDLLSETIQGEQGQVFDLRVTAQDGAGNKMTSPSQRTVIPYDDSNPANGATFFGLWEEREHPTAYLEGIHVSRTELDRFYFNGTGTKYCIAFRTGEEFGRATFQVDNQFGGVDMSRIVYPSSANYSCMSFRDVMERTAEVRVAEGTINIDGFWVETQPNG